MKRQFEMAGKKIGEGLEPILLPELGTYFNSDIDEAVRSIDLCVEAGCQIIKGEVFHSPDIVLQNGFELEYNTNHGLVKEQYYEIIKRKVLPFDDWKKIYSHCKSCGLDFVVSAYDRATVDFLESIGACCIKISGSNINNLPLLSYAAQTGMPLMLDARRCYLSDIALAMETVEKNGASKVILNHSCDGSPSPANEHNLTIIESYSSLFGCPIGLSCHYSGEQMVYAAAALGYSLIEKPFCLNPDVVDVDTPWALPLERLSDVLCGMKTFHDARGSPLNRSYANPDLDPARMGLYASEDLAKGCKLTIENVSFKWPNNGTSVRFWELIEGMKLREHTPKNTPINFSSVE